MQCTHTNECPAVFYLGMCAPCASDAREHVRRSFSQLLFSTWKAKKKFLEKKKREGVKVEVGGGGGESLANFATTFKSCRRHQLNFSIEILFHYMQKNGPFYAGLFRHTDRSAQCLNIIELKVSLKTRRAHFRSNIENRQSGTFLDFLIYIVR